MRFAAAFTAIITSALLSPIVQVGASNLLNRDISVDVCGEVDAELKLPPLLGIGLPVSIGLIQECLCISTIPQYVSSNLLVLGAVALFGKAAVIAELTTMVNNCGSRTQCNYPAHSFPSCKSGSPCYYTCKDGYTAYPAGAYPTQCVCAYPYTECNGKCGTYQGCPSTYLARRDGHKRCHKGFTACNVPGRSDNTWECIDTQNDLESCGGCAYDLGASSGADCTAIAGVSDVSCIKGECVVHKCMFGYDLDDKHSQCIYSEDKDPQLLAAQFGLEHSQL
ncbi:hypothetical protein C8R46DRAFT_912829 [Mycena filopes]|nr:hypothetical protein C8R46DRAFT_912829 [Mycena filopes]